MSLSRLELDRIAARIEHLMRQPTWGWHPVDELDFCNSLPGAWTRQALPSPQFFRNAVGDEEGLVATYRDTLQRLLRMEGLVRDNDPRNPRRMMRDMARGKFPGMR